MRPTDPQPTRHLHHRCNSRGIPFNIVALALEFGRIEGDKYVLGQKDLRSLIRDIDSLRSLALKALDKGGIVAVEADGRTITTYRPNSDYEVH